MEPPRCETISSSLKDPEETILCTERAQNSPKCPASEGTTKDAAPGENYSSKSCWVPKKGCASLHGLSTGAVTPRQVWRAAAPQDDAELLLQRLEKQQGSLLAHCLLCLFNPRFEVLPPLIAIPPCHPEQGQEVGTEVSCKQRSQVGAFGIFTES